jgi:hypothetical protein
VKTRKASEDHYENHKDMRALDGLEDGKDEDKEDREDVAHNTSDAAFLDQIDTEEDGGSLQLTHEQVNLGKFAIHKITNLAKKIFPLPTIRAELSWLCTEKNIKDWVLVCPVPTHWNSVAEMLESALHLYEVLSDLCDMAQFNKHDGIRLHQYVLNDAE